MPRAFDVTAASPSIKLNSAGVGEFSFTVSNALRRAVRGRVIAKAEGQAKDEWFTIDGDAERDFAADGTQQFTVKVKAPAGTPPATYACHLLVSTITNPDEEYATGPSVSFAVPATEAPKKPFPWWMVAVAAGVLLLIGGSIALFSKLRGPGLGDDCDAIASKCPSTMTCMTPAALAAAGKTVAPPNPQDRHGRARERFAAAADAGTGTGTGGSGVAAVPGLCLANEGTKCKEDTDCAAGTCQEDGKCGFPPPGADCQADPDCPGNQKCVALAQTGSKSCLLKPDRPCSRDVDCSSFWCKDSQKVCGRDDGLCKDDTECRTPVFTCFNGRCGKQVGQPCTQPVECTTGFCNGTCLPAPPCFGFFCPQAQQLQQMQRENGAFQQNTAPVVR